MIRKLTSVLELDDLVSSKLVRVHVPRILSKDIEARITRGLGSLSTPVVTRPPNRLSLRDRDECKDAEEPGRLLGSEDSKGLGPVWLNGESGDVHAKAHASVAGCPYSSPSEHAHAAVLNFGLLEKLSVWEHVGESVYVLAKFGQLKRIPEFTANLSKLTTGGVGGCSQRH